MARSTRRELLALAAVAVPAAAITTVAAGQPANAIEADPELRRLWSEYLNTARAYAGILAAYEPVRNAFDAEMPSCPPGVLPGDHWRSQQPLWRRYGLDDLCAAWNRSAEQVRQTIAAIQTTDAEGLVGIGIKLAAMPMDVPDEVDLAEAVASVMRDIARLTGIEFVADAAAANPGLVS